MDFTAWWPRRNVCGIPEKDRKSSKTRVVKWQVLQMCSALFWKIKVQKRIATEQNPWHFKILAAWSWAANYSVGKIMNGKCPGTGARESLRQCCVALPHLGVTLRSCVIFSKFSDLSGLQALYLWQRALRLLVVFKYLFRLKPCINFNVRGTVVIGAGRGSGNPARSASPMKHLWGT